MQKKALITGILGQDGAFMAKLLLNNGYSVIGVDIDISDKRMSNLRSLGIEKDIEIFNIDIANIIEISGIVKNNSINEIYNLAAMSFVGKSFEDPILTQNINFMSVMNILESIRQYSQETKFFQASSSEIFGNVSESPQIENTPYHPRSPYGVSKLAAHWATINYQESFGLHTSAGILFNHESEFRGESFVTQKIVKYVVSYSKNQDIESLKLGNLDTHRDWAHAEDFVRGMWLMLQQEKGDQYVLATGKTHTVREFVESAFRYIDVEIEWRKSENPLAEKGIDTKTGKIIVEINEEFYRPSEKVRLVGDASKAKNILNWEPEISFEVLIKRMVNFSLKI